MSEERNDLLNDDIEEMETEDRDSIEFNKKKKSLS